MPRPSKAKPSPIPKAPVSASTLEMFVPPSLLGDLRLLSQIQRRPLENQIIATLDLGIRAEKEWLAKRDAPPPKPPPPPPPPAKPAPVAMAYQSIRTLAHTVIDQLKPHVTADDLPYLLGELSRYAIACRSLLLHDPINEEDDD